MATEVNNTTIVKKQGFALRKGDVILYEGHAKLITFIPSYIPHDSFSVGTSEGTITIHGYQQYNVVAVPPVPEPVEEIEYVYDTHIRVGDDIGSYLPEQDVPVEYGVRVGQV